MFLMVAIFSPCPAFFSDPDANKLLVTSSPYDNNIRLKAPGDLYYCYDSHLEIAVCNNHVNVGPSFLCVSRMMAAVDFYQAKATAHCSELL